MFDIVNIAAPLFVEKLYLLSAGSNALLRFHTAFQVSPKLRSAGGGPQVTVTVCPEYTVCGEKFKEFEPTWNTQDIDQV